MPVARIPSGLNLHWTEDGSGPPVVMVMGLALSSHAWNHQLPLAARWRLIRFDNRGIGGSDAPPGPYDTRAMAADVLGLLDTLGVRRAHLVGVSMGGMIAQHVALRAPHRVASLALLATHGGGPTSHVPPRTVGLFAKSKFGRTAEARIDALASLLFPPDFLDAHGERVRDALHETVSHAKLSGRVFLSQVAAVIGHRTGVTLGALDGLPTLLVTGDQDRAVNPVNTSLLHRWMPWARRVVLPGVGHGLLAQAVDEVNDTLDAHLSAAESASRAE